MPETSRQIIFLKLHKESEGKEVNVNFTLEQVMKAHRGNRDIALLFSLTWALDGVGGQRHAPVALLLAYLLHGAESFLRS
jgi:hypothetical protein